MTGGFDATPVLAGLTTFQRDTVDHVVGRFFGADPTDRFLVADQTGLGKTMVARGVIARTIEALQHDAGTDRVDIVYVCSNQDLARQNLRKLAVGGGAASEFTARLSMLGTVVSDFPRRVAEGPAPINLVSFTPGTSFKPGWRSGTKEERALLLLMLECEPSLQLTTNAGRAAAALRFLMCGVRTVEAFEGVVAEMRSQVPHLDQSLVDAFRAGLRRPDQGVTPLERVREELESAARGTDTGRTWQTVGWLRAVMARASVSLLTPDLVILDEFQRFRELLAKDTDAGELAHHLFDHASSAGSRAKVLLLSATPYKPFTYAEEVSAGEDHHRDFMKVVRFLGDGDPGDPAGAIEAALRSYREGVVRGDLTRETTEAVRAATLRIMCRTERPDGATVSMRREVALPMGPPSADNLLGYVALKELSDVVGGQVNLGYWKDVPYFASFMSGYKLAGAVTGALSGPDGDRAAQTRRLLARTQRLHTADVDANAPIAMSHPRLETVHRHTVGRGWPRLLWVPPSLPYLEPAGAYAEPGASSVSKLLVFSSWAATPTALSSLLSYEADRVTASPHQGAMSADERAADRRSRATRLNYRWNAQYDRAGSMSALALFWPMPGLAGLADPLAHRRAVGTSLSIAAFEERVIEALRTEHPTAEGDDPPATPWAEAMRRLDSLPGGLSERDVREALDARTWDPETDRDAELGLLARHVSIALAARGTPRRNRLDGAGLVSLARLAAHSPGNIAWRAVRRLVGADTPIMDGEQWIEAARLAVAIRSLFARPETTMLLDPTDGDGNTPYWQRILRYCAEGNLQAVLDEHLHHVAVSLGGSVTDADSLHVVVGNVVEALSFRAARYALFAPDTGGTNPTSFSTRFAVRYGSGRGETLEEGATQRQHQVRQAFNSPFWPFVLATTSIGQEGIDFHWWCRSVLHWNTPTNPVDFEQREGRVDRYDGLAVRRNIMATHAQDVFAAEADDPWAAAYEIAANARPDLGSFAPHWVYPGKAQIERYVAPYPLSTDGVRLERIRRDVARYRLTFGQPRQEDLLEILRDRLGADGEVPDHWRVDLRPPAR
ncbi:hypothetical protein [Mobilicoccus sp.]|uniref:hypothetical protein n=1 Tax=Mobilicoccus sp. TaxID=2034349 RepID=UPI0028B10D5A|nr:hypothetical protein [Mobilicoccus sp.]